MSDGETKLLLLLYGSVILGSWAFGAWMGHSTGRRFGYDDGWFEGQLEGYREGMLDERKSWVAQEESR